MTTTWDYFISHATEDKDLVARPLAHVLVRSRFRVWYDEFSLHVGDSLFQSISRGLAESSFGVVVLSPSFMQKSWTQNELGGIWARETLERKLLLPVWHQVSASQVVERSPMLADRFAVSTKQGLQRVAEELVRASFPDRLADLPISIRPSDSNESAHGRDVLRELLDRGAGVDDLRLLLSAYQELLPRRGMLIPSFKLDASDLADFIVVRQEGVTGPMRMDLVLLGPCVPDQDDSGELGARMTTSLVAKLGSRTIRQQRGFNDNLGPPYVGEYTRLLQVGSDAVQLLTGEEALSPDSSLDDLQSGDDGRWNVHMKRPDLWSARIVVIVGRRSPDAMLKKHDIAKEFNNLVEVASYDRLLDRQLDR